MQKPKQPIPAYRKRIYWVLFLLLCGSIVWVFAQLTIQSIAFNNLLLQSNVSNEDCLEVNRKYNDAINQFNKAYSLQNTYGFTDVNHAFEAPDSMLRIAILGDSYIWGDGLHYTQTWNHQMAARLNLEYTNVEVLHWGRNGWNFPDHQRWIVEEGKKFKVDMVLLGWCFNDLFGKGNNSLLQFQQRNSGNRYLNAFYKETLQEGNLKAYIESLKTIRDTLASRGIRFVVYMVSHPTHKHVYMREVLHKRFGQVGIEFYDPQSYMRWVIPVSLDHNLLLDANLTNGHSGFILNYFKADAAYLWLKSQPQMAKARRKQLPNPDAVNKWNAQ